jgi:hypothetical protein
VGKHRKRRRARIERPTGGTETWRSNTRCGPFCRPLDAFHHGARRPRGGRGRHGSDDDTTYVIEPWGCYSTRHS